MMNQDNSDFDINLICSSLEKYCSDPNSLDLDAFLTSYKELLKLFQILGQVFVFVVKDIDSKISILDSYRNDREKGKIYQTVQSFIQYEKEANLLQDEHRPSGARTLLRLNRALEFVSMFITEINKIDDYTGTGNSAREAYHKTLAKYHPWYIRQAASIAMYTMPTKAQFVSKVFHKYPHFEEKSIGNIMEKFSRICDNCYNITQKFYEQNKLESLP